MHLKAPFRILRAVQPVISAAVKAERAAGVPRVTRKVVNISSIAGTSGNVGQANYASAKAGVTGLTKALAKEWGRYDVTVNCVAYGLIRTRLTEATAGGDARIDVAGRDIKVGVNAELLAQLEQGIPLGRAGTPVEAAGAAYLFSSPKATMSAGKCWSAGVALRAERHLKDGPPHRGDLRGQSRARAEATYSHEAVREGQGGVDEHPGLGVV